MRIDSSGRVGIGVTAQTAKLQIVGENNASSTPLGKIANSQLHLDHTTHNDAIAQIGFGYPGSSAVYSAASMGFISTLQDNFGKGDLFFATRNVNTDSVPTERMRIDSNGNVGIGTNAPSDYNAAAHNLVLYESGGSGMTLASGTSGQGAIYFADGTSGDAEYRGYIIYEHGSNDHMRFGTGGAEHMRIDSNGDVAIGTTDSLMSYDSNSTKLTVYDSTGSAQSGYLELGANATVNGYNAGAIQFINNNNADGSDTDAADTKCVGQIRTTIVTSDSNAGDDSGGTMEFYTKPEAGGLAQRMTIDSSGNLLVGTTDTSLYNNTSGGGLAYRPGNELTIAAETNPQLILNQTGSDGEMMRFVQDGTAVGKIGSNNSGTEMFICGSASSCSGIFFNLNGVLPMVNGSVSDNTEDLGQPDLRWDDIHATNGTIQTSDENEKQDIASMTTAELAVGKRLSALFKTL
jgi:hypothetical protein